MSSYVKYLARNFAITQRYFAQESHASIAQEYGISLCRVSQLTWQTCRRLNRPLYERLVGRSLSLTPHALIPFREYFLGRKSIPENIDRVFWDAWEEKYTKRGLLR